MIDRYTQPSIDEVNQLKREIKDLKTSLRERCIDYSLRQSNNESTIGQLIQDAEIIFRYISEGDTDVNSQYEEINPD